MDNILHERIKEKILQLEDIKNFVTEPLVIVVDSPKLISDIGNSFYFLTNKNLNDIEEFCKLRIRSSDNSFTTSKLDYANLEMSRYNCFRDYLEIELMNYNTFTPFKLEFLKVQPIYHDII